MKKPYLITLILALSTLFAQAQNSTPHHSQPDSLIKLIPVGEGNHSSYLYTIGGKLQTPEDVKMKILAYAPSALEYRAAKKSAVWSWVSLGGFAASGTAATIEYATHNKSAGETIGVVNGKPEFIYQHHNLTGAYIFTGLASAFLVSTVINFVKAARHGKKSIKLYNAQYE
ncbi:hypothetical protein FO440_02905 [Mucilaginibacter corticis]|uniref:Uncharacterized protein n=1 Tax=Mucilaginibacter corticis TaxID=2597670 RepID=A0A556MTF6_9SPHI|nr:hypothetical protein [Mucilaginibacter corticis]TSJ43157.1 hypothetical protein FO440_02905 [Mucilaginibacter corticis]